MIDLLEIAAEQQREAHRMIRMCDRVGAREKDSRMWIARGLQSRRDIETLTAIACAVDEGRVG